MTLFWYFFFFVSECLDSTKAFDYDLQNSIAYLNIMSVNTKYIYIVDPWNLNYPPAPSLSAQSRREFWKSREHEHWFLPDKLC